MESCFQHHLSSDQNDANLGAGFRYIFFIFTPILGKMSNLTNIFQGGSNHQLVIYIVSKIGRVRTHPLKKGRFALFNTCCLPP